MGKKRSVMPNFIFGLIIVLTIIISGILTMVVEFGIGMITMFLFSMTYAEFLANPRPEFMILVIAFIGLMFFAMIMIYSFVFRLAGFRRK